MQKNPRVRKRLQRSASEAETDLETAAAEAREKFRAAYETEREKDEGYGSRLHDKRPQGVSQGSCSDRFF